jgi:exodeoxyribonuclease V alpha subunit
MSKPQRVKKEIDLSGRLEHLIFHNQENHYTIARLRADEGGGRIAIVGHLPGARAGAHLHLRGHWERHRRWGDQFRFVSVEETLPAEVDEIRAYLTGGLIPGLGSRGAALVDHFGAETLTILDEHPERLTEIRGIGPKTAAKIVAGWREHHATRQLLAFLKANTVPAVHAARLVKTYGDEALGILKSDPYRVVSDIPHFGFEIADRIVQRSELAIPADQRAQACLLHLLEQAESRGDCYLPQEHLLQLGGQRFDLDAALAGEALETLAATHEVVIEMNPDASTVSVWPSAGSDPDPGEPASPAVFSAFLHHCETRVAAQLAAMAQLPALAHPPDRATLQKIVARDLAVALSEDQLEVLAGVLGERMAIITGGPGTGKTTLIRSLTTILREQGRVVGLAAPTGRATRLLAAVTGRKAETIHRLLAYSVAEGRFRHDRSDPLDLDVLIVDEASMLDLPLFYHLMEALPLTACLLLVGDVYQLPSVGPGTVLADLIASQKVATFDLTTIHRQARHSGIVTVAHRIRRGETHALDLTADPGSVYLEDGGDFHFLPTEGPAATAEQIVTLCSRHIPDAFGLDPLTEIQVLTPMHKGEVGTLQLNQALQEALNPQPADAPKARLRSGDKVIQMRNNYAKEVFNGEVGVVALTELDADAGVKQITVIFEEREVDYNGEEIEELSLAYAISVHKSQGSEYPAVVIPLVTQHYVMLQRNLLYTAITRGEQLVVLVGSPKALRVALSNDRPMRRRTGLRARLVASLAVRPPA